MLITSCTRDSGLPVFPEGGLLATAQVPPPAVNDSLDGMYQVLGPVDQFGNRVAVVARDGWVSIFGNRNSVYAMMRPGCVDGSSKMVLEGVWRFAPRERWGLIRLFVEPEDAARALCQGKPSTGAYQFTGAVSEGGAHPDETMSLIFDGPLFVSSPPFRVVAHRGGCRTSDGCGASENSLEVIRLARGLGADAVEIDIRMTADGIPILYHDESFSHRLTRGVFCLGPVSEFSLEHLRALCRLENGEEIPTLDDALRVVIEETSLKGVWLDLKTPSAIGSALKSTAVWRKRARDSGRDIDLVHGLYSEEMVDAWIAASPPAEASCLVELDPKDLRGTGCKIWAPRWTLGPMAEKVKKIQESGRIVTFWTLDEEEFIDAMLSQARPNAILTNRPGLVLHRFQTLGLAPWGTP
jgi:glycerophosphoryl diester phosphodiesterase